MGAAPLEGVRVVDLTTFLAGPFAAHALGQLGAEVVKVEPPGGDPTRAGQAVPSGSFWTSLHRGRRSIVLDLKTDAGRRVLRDLVRGADVLVVNARPGVTERLGVSWPELRSINPQLVFCSITGDGSSGVLGGGAAVDGAVQAFAGAFHLPAVVGLPVGPVPATIGDLGGGAAAAQGVLAGLVRRARTGEGCSVEVSLVDVLLDWLSVADWVGSLRWPNTVVATGSDGLAFVVQTPLHFRARLAALLGLEYADTDEYGEAVRRVLAGRPRAAWLDLLAAEAIPAAPVNTLAEALADPRIATVEHRGEVVPASPFVVDGERLDLAPAPVLAADAAALLADLGYDDAAVEQLRAEGAFGPPAT